MFVLMLLMTSSTTLTGMTRRLSSGRQMAVFALLWVPPPASCDPLRKMSVLGTSFPTVMEALFLPFPYSFPPSLPFSSPLAHQG